MVDRFFRYGSFELAIYERVNIKVSYIFDSFIGKERD